MKKDLPEIETKKFSKRSLLYIVYIVYIYIWKKKRILRNITFESQSRDTYTISIFSFLFFLKIY
jgi:hypothetical protein